jgi:hypothetical protein
MFCQGRQQWIQEVKAMCFFSSHCYCCLYSHTHLSPHALTQAEFVRKGLAKQASDARSTRARSAAANRGMEEEPYTEVELSAAKTILQMINDRITAIQLLIQHDTTNLKLRFYWGKSMCCCSYLLYCQCSSVLHLPQPHISYASTPICYASPHICYASPHKCSASPHICSA